VSFPSEYVKIVSTTGKCEERRHPRQVKRMRKGGQNLRGEFLTSGVEVSSPNYRFAKVSWGPSSGGRIGGEDPVVERSCKGALIQRTKTKKSARRVSLVQWKATGGDPEQQRENPEEKG